MQFAVALIEYLISGIVASIWVFFLMKHHFPLPEEPLELLTKYKELVVVIYFPLVYILGIYVDTLSSFLIRRFKQLDASSSKCCLYRGPRKAFATCFALIAGDPKSDAYGKSSKILAQSIPDAARTMESYVSRDRIARGMALNALCGAIVAWLYAPEPYRMSSVITCLIVTVVSLFMYVRLHRLSSQFKAATVRNIETTVRNTEASKGSNVAAAKMSLRNDRSA